MRRDTPVLSINTYEAKTKTHITVTCAEDDNGTDEVIHMNQDSGDDERWQLSMWERAGRANADTGKWMVKR